MKVGLIGLGLMGHGMAESLLRGGHELTVYNRTASKADALVAKGARLAKTPADACRGDVVITMLADDAAVEEVTFGAHGILENLSVGAVHVSASTISVALADRLTIEHSQSGKHFVSAPVFGRPQVAAAGQLNILAAGAAEPVKRVLPVLESMAQKVWPFGERPSAANLVKLSGNFMIFAAVEALAESIALIRKGGVDEHAFVDLMTSTLFAAPIYKGYAPLITKQQYQPPGFAAPLGLKDVRLALTAGESLKVPLPLGSLVRDKFLTLLARGGEGDDIAALGKVAAEQAGM
ncbi:NAD(P)-dependent oxidoreductase [Peristeroidobacter soli]|jgi:3-hydroxyisobutyrate dehydrogenase-like beta-hydroxyacid dehydrogenase|uniref:NAD(P)-dependent oxidoreductase n=1 Tax=Peristeroidobacter soli TaxID=2497877 RepID=UPI00101BA01A|nr:NAD(P)-dependent oxidoreductase [Peristeroidobacter soli]